MTGTVFAICVVVVFLLACATGAVFGHSITEEFRRHRRAAPEPDDECIDLLEECARKHGLPAPPPPPVGGSGQATAWDAEDPQVPQCPRAPSTSDRLRLWTYDFEFIEELDPNVMLRNEGRIRLPVGSTAERRLDAASDTGELVWLTVTGPRGHWIGWSTSRHVSSDRPMTIDFEFRAEPNWGPPVWAGWSA